MMVQAVISASGEVEIGRMEVQGQSPSWSKKLGRVVYDYALAMWEA
jgi:hypothetical protein